MMLETIRTSDSNDQLDENKPEDERKSEVLGAQSELKSRERFATLLSTDRVRVFESGTKGCRFTLSNLVRESGTF